MERIGPGMSDSAELLGAISAGGPLHRLHAYWRARCREGRLPGRADIDPVELRFAMGSMILIDVLREPLRFRYRLTGTLLARFLKHDMTGKLLDAHPDPTFRAEAAKLWTELVDTARPMAFRRDTIMDNRLRRYDVLMLPLAADGATVDMILVGMRFD